MPFTFHAEAETPSLLKKELQKGLAAIEGSAAGDAAANKTAAKPGKTAGGAEKPKGPTLDDARQALAKLVEEKGKPEGKKAIQAASAKYTKIGDLKGEADFQKVIDYCEAALSGEEASGGDDDDDPLAD